MEKTDRAALNALAASQCALLTRAQLRAHPMTDSLIEWRVTSKRWRPVHPGVYLTSPGRGDWAMTAMAGVLSAAREPCCPMVARATPSV